MNRYGFTIVLVAALTAAQGCAAPPTGKAPAREVLPFSEDDYDLALSEAKARNLPIFVEVWAPW